MNSKVELYEQGGGAMSTGRWSCVNREVELCVNREVELYEEGGGAV